MMSSRNWLRDARTDYYYRKARQKMSDEKTIPNVPAQLSVLEMYESLMVATVAIPVSQLRAMEDERRRLQVQIDELCGT